MSRNSRNRLLIEARLNSSPTSLSANFRPEATFSPIDWEKKILQGWINVRKTLVQAENPSELRKEIDNASRNIFLSKKRITELEKQLQEKDVPLNLSIAASSAIQYVNTFKRRVINARKNGV